MEQYLQIYCDYYQDDWSQLLSLAEIVYNNAKNASTGISPFYINYRYYPRATLKILPDKQHKHPAAETYLDHIQQVHKKLQITLEQAQARYNREFDQDAALAPEFKVGDLVWLNRKNIEMIRPSQKLHFRRLGPFEIVKVVGESKAAVELKLPSQ